MLMATIFSGDPLDVSAAIKLAYDGHLVAIQQQNAEECAITNMQLRRLFFCGSW